MDQEKLNFITNDCIGLFKKLSGDAAGKWGKMNGQQVVEHVAAVFMGSAEKIKFELTTPREHLPKYLEFLYSDKQFREYTKAPEQLIGEEPHPLRYRNMEEALEKLAGAIGYFQTYFTDHAGKKTMHPVFGELDHAEWVLLHYKHVTHHLRQFGLM